MFKPVMGIQLYTLRDHIKTPEDFDSTLAKLKEMGVDTVQISGIGDFPAEKQREILDKHGMKVCVTHKPFNRMEEDLDNLAKEHEIIGCDAIGLGCGPAEYRGRSTEVRKFIEKVQEIGKKLKEKGMTFNYHNHAFEFHRLDDVKYNMMDLLINETDPECVHFIPDVAWISYGKENPAEYLKNLKGRVKVLHFKDYIFDEEGYRRFVPLGKGLVDLKACYKTACELEIPYIMYEQDCDWENNDPFISTKESWEFMQSLQK